MCAGLRAYTGSPWFLLAPRSSESLSASALLTAGESILVQLDTSYSPIV